MPAPPPSLSAPQARFLGTTPATSSPPALLASLIRHLRRAYGSGDGDPVPTAADELAAAFAQCLRLANEARPLLLVLDSLDQIASAGTHLGWLPLASPPPHVRLVVSAASGLAARFEDKLPAMLPEGHRATAV